MNRGIVLNIVMIVLICILLGGEIYLFVCLKCLKKKSKYELPEDINERTIILSKSATKSEILQEIQMSAIPPRIKK